MFVFSNAKFLLKIKTPKILEAPRAVLLLRAVAVGAGCSCGLPRCDLRH